MANRKNTFLLKRSNVAGKVPVAGDLQLGELAINTADVILFASGTTSNSILPIGWDRVARTGDTMTGSLYAPNISATTISATTYLNLPSMSSFYLPLSGGTVYGNTIFTSGLTASTLYTSVINFDINYTGATAVGSMTWNSTFGTPQVGLIGGNVVQKIGETIFSYVRNDEATTLNKGEVVYIFGATGDKISVKRASNTGDTTSSKTLGVVAESIVSGGLGYIITQGTLDGLNLGSYTAGDTLWLGVTPGQMTNVKQYAPNHTVFIGVVQRANNGNGQLYVLPQNGYELEELHNVMSTGATYGDLLTFSAYNGSNVWVNSKTLNGSYTITGDTTVGGQLKATSISATTYLNLPIDVRVTGATYSNNTFTYTNNTGGTFSALFNTMTGLTITGNLTVTGGTSSLFSGNVGMGVTNPVIPLHVRSTAIPSDRETIAQFDVSDDSSYFRFSNATGANSNFIPTLEGYNSSDKIAMYFIGEGTTDIGTESLIRFDARIGITQVINRPLFQWSNYGDVKMTMLANGNVGIGTTTPIAKLDVSGDARISGGLTANTISATTYQNYPKSTPYTLNKSEIVTATTVSDNFNTGIRISGSPISNSYVGVAINGLNVEVGDGVTTKDCYFSSDGTSGGVRNFSGITTGDYFMWNTTISEYDLDSNDIISFYYNILV
jgi:hypothetical protein